MTANQIPRPEFPSIFPVGQLLTVILIRVMCFDLSCSSLVSELVINEPLLSAATVNSGLALIKTQLLTTNHKLLPTTCDTDSQNKK